MSTVKEIFSVSIIIRIIVSFFFPYVENFSNEQAKCQQVFRQEIEEALQIHVYMLKSICHVYFTTLKHALLFIIQIHKHLLHIKFQITHSGILSIDVQNESVVHVYLYRMFEPICGRSFGIGEMKVVDRFDLVIAKWYSVYAQIIMCN